MTEEARSYRAEPELGFADRLERDLLRRLAAGQPQSAAANSDRTVDMLPVVDIDLPQGGTDKTSSDEPTNRRPWLLAAAAAAAVLLIVAIVLLQGTGDNHIRTTPAAPDAAPTTTTPPTIDPAAYVGVADSFMAAWVAGDSDGVVDIIGKARYATRAGQPSQVNIGLWESFDPEVDAPVSSRPSSRGLRRLPDTTLAVWRVAALPALHDWFRALGWEFRREPCRLVGNNWPEIPDSATVVCNYTYENDLTRAVRRAPVTGQFVLNVVGDKVARFEGGMFDLDADIWQMFSDWVRREHADDFAAMYYPKTLPLAPRLDKASIALWDRHVGEFVSSPDAHTPAPGAPTRAEFGAKARMICATAAFETPGTRVALPGPLAQASQSAMEQLRALPRPEEDAAQIDQLFSLLEEINRRVVADDWFHNDSFYNLQSEKDRLGGRDFWGCPAGPLGA